MKKNNYTLNLLSILAVFSTLLRLSLTSAFSINGSSRSRANPLKLANDFDDFISDADEGKDLAKQFYKQVKKREEERARGASNVSTSSPSSSKETWDVQPQVPQKKFTGRRGEIDSTGTPSAGLFANENGSVYAYPVDGTMEGRNSRPGYSPSSDVLTPRERMMRDEINFMRVASSEVTIIAQAVFVLIILAFTIYIGSTGGITDGSDRFGTMDGIANEYNGLGESIDFSSLVNDDSSVVGSVVKEGSVWL
mmetsp:Transcript_6451/g.9442  ORF Transcript_6451/g.9442 Transcript_6451/m.9442 type:complete len:251 (-) Transcript_6451:249-1001(-)